MSTIEAHRPATVELRPQRSSTLGVTVPAIPDHVPADVAAQHPDAAAVVSSGRPHRGGVRVVSRGEQRRSPAGAILALVACAALAAGAAGASPSDQGTDPVIPAPAAPATGPTVTTSNGVAEASCAPGASVVVRCDPPCPVPSPLAFPLGGCAPRR